MAKYLILILAALPLTIVWAWAQVGADLSAPGGVGDLSATGFSANLSAPTGAAVSVATAGGRFGGQVRVGSSSPSTGTLSPTLGSSSSRKHTASRAPLLNSFDQVLQQTARSSARSASKSVFPKASTTNSGFASLGSPSVSSAGAQSIRAPRSFTSGTPTSQTPLYSFLISQGRTGSGSGIRQQRGAGNGMRSRNRKGALIESLTGTRSSGGSSR
jgi:hypothetical protein